MPQGSAPGVDPYSDDHPRGTLNRSLRDKAREAHRLFETQAVTTRVPSAGAAEDKAVSEATTAELADAIAEAVDRRQQQPTLQESMRSKTIQLLRVHQATYGGVRQAQLPRDTSKLTSDKPEGQ